VKKAPKPSKPWSFTKRRRDYYEPLPILTGDQVKIYQLKGRRLKQYNNRIGYITTVFGHNLFEVEIKVPESEGATRLISKKLRVNSLQIAQVYSPKRQEGAFAAEIVAPKQIFEYRLSNHTQFDAISVRERPMEGSKLTGKRVGENGETFDVDRIRTSPRGQVYLHLNDGSGWVFTKNPGDMEETVAVCIGERYEAVGKPNPKGDVTSNRWWAAKYHSVPLHLLEENKEDYVDSHDDFAPDETSKVRRKKLRRPTGLEEIEDIAGEMAAENLEMEKMRVKVRSELALQKKRANRRSQKEAEARDFMESMDTLRDAGAAGSPESTPEVPPPEKRRLLPAPEVDLGFGQRVLTGLTRVEELVEAARKRKDDREAERQRKIKAHAPLVDVERLLESRYKLLKEKRRNATSEWKLKQEKARRDARVKFGRMRRWAQAKAKEDHKKSSFSRTNLKNKLRAQGIDPRGRKVGFALPRMPVGAARGN